VLPSTTYGNYAFLYDATLAPSGDCDFMTAAIATRNFGNMNAGGKRDALGCIEFAHIGIQFHFITITCLVMTILINHELKFNINNKQIKEFEKKIRIIVAMHICKLRHNFLIGRDCNKLLWTRTRFK